MGLILAETVGLGGLILAGVFSFLSVSQALKSPIIHFAKQETETPVTITLSNNNLVRISQLTMNVYPGSFRIEEAEFFISLMPEVSFGTYLKNLAREQLLNSPRLVTGVAWQSQSIIPPVTVVQGSIDQVGYDQAVANTIRVQVFGNRVTTL